MVCPVAIQLIRAPGRDVAFRINRPSDCQGPGKSCVRGFSTLGQLDSQLVPHPRPRRRVLQEEAHQEQLADFDKLILLLVGFGYGPGARICGEIACCETCV